MRNREHPFANLMSSESVNANDDFFFLVCWGFFCFFKKGHWCLQTMTQSPLVNSEWNCKTVDFTGSSWGIKANMQKFADGSFRFTFPLMVTEVVKESQAALAGLRVFDHIVAYKRKNCSDFVSVTSNDINDDKGVVNFSSKCVFCCLSQKTSY